MNCALSMLRDLPSRDTVLSDTVLGDTVPERKTVRSRICHCSVLSCIRRSDFAFLETGTFLTAVLALARRMEDLNSDRPQNAKSLGPTPPPPLVRIRPSISRELNPE